jgi:hypothetical protein
MTNAGKQLELPLPRLSAAERKAWIRNRLWGLEYRQTVRKAKREASYERRRAREAGTLERPPQPEQMVLPMPSSAEAQAPAPKQLPLPIAPFWTL